MSQVDDWADGYADSARDVNLYGPASANVPRSSVVSHQVRYRAPDTSDIPLAPGQNPESSVYSNASGARMGQTKPASGYRAPAGGGWDMNSSDTNIRFPNESGSRRYASSKTKASAKPARKRTQKPAASVKSSAPAKSAATDYGSYKDQSDPLSQHILANGSSGGAASAESVASGARDVTGQSDMYRAIARLSSADTASTDRPSYMGAADTASTDRPSYMGAAGTMADNFARTLPQPSAASRQTDPESSSIEGQFKNMPWYKDAKAHHEAVKKNMDDYGSALGTLKSTWDDIPWWTKLVMLPPVFKAGSPAAGASAAGNVWAEGGRAAAGDAAAGAAAGDAAAGAGGRSFGFDLSAEDVAAANAANAAARQQAIDLSEMRSTLIRAGMPDREINVYMHRAGFYNDPEALRQAIDVVNKYGMAGLFEHSAARAGSAAGTGAGSAAGTGAGSAAGTGVRGSFRFDLSPEEIASAKASHDAYVRGAAGAADGGVSKLAEAGNVGRETAAGAATGSVSEGVDSVPQQLIEHIRSGTLDEMERAWIEATAAGAAKAPGTIDASTQAILNEARAAGILGREAAGTAGAADGGVSELANAGNAGREAAAGGQAASREAIVAARNAAVAKLDPQLQAALANVRKSLANHNISPRQVLHELGSPTASDKDFYEIGRIFFEVGRATHGAGLSPAEQAVANAYAKSFSERMSRSWTEVGRGLTLAADKNTARDLIDGIKDGTLDPNSVAYIRLLATRNAELTPDGQALIDAARSAGLIP